MLEAGGEHWCAKPGVFGCRIPAWQEAGARPQLSSWAWTQMPEAEVTPAVAAFASWLLWRPVQHCGCLLEGGCLCAVGTRGQGRRSPHSRISTVERTKGSDLLWDRECNLPLQRLPLCIHSPAMDPRFFTTGDEPQIWLQSPDPSCCQPCGSSLSIAITYFYI